MHGPDASFVAGTPVQQCRGMPSRFTAVFVVGLLLSGCSGGGQPTTSGITSVLVMKHGRIVRESYYGGLEAGDRLPVFSITKSVTSALVGIAIADGSLSGLDERLPWRRQIALRQLLSMTAGYAPSFDFEPSDAQTLATRARVNRVGTFRLRQRLARPRRGHGRTRHRNVARRLCTPAPVRPDGNPRRSLAGLTRRVGPAPAAAPAARVRRAVPRGRRANRPSDLAPAVHAPACRHPAWARLRVRLVDPAALVRGLRLSRASARDLSEARRGCARDIVTRGCETARAGPPDRVRMTWR